MTTLADPSAEGRRIVEAADAAGLPIRVVGGVGVALIAPTVGQLRPIRTYHDIDLAAPARAPAIARLMAALGYGASTEFNALNGAERMLFHDPGGRRIDVFIDTLRMCHELRFRDRLTTWPLTLSPADLLLSKLQIVELTDRDAQDVLALLADHALTEAHGGGIDLRRIREVCATDWGWWRTVDVNVAALIARWEQASGTGAARVGRADADAPPEASSTALERARDLRSHLAAAPKSVGWRLRAMVGPRLRWYESPEEVR
jgi:hypothetical protein